MQDLLFSLSRKWEIEKSLDQLKKIDDIDVRQLNVTGKLFASFLTVFTLNIFCQRQFYLCNDK